jgi:hypothetical protein
MVNAEAGEETAPARILTTLMTYRHKRDQYSSRAALATAFAFSSAVSRSSSSGLEPAGRDVVPIEELAGPIVREANLKAPATRDGLVFDDPDAVCHACQGSVHRPECYVDQERSHRLDLQPTGQWHVPATAVA